MNQRVIAATLAIPLMAVLAVTALVVPLPYTTYAPGPTIDVLADPGGKEIIQIPGQQTYRDDGQLRMTTVSVTPKESDLNLLEVMAGWIDPSKAVYPKEAVYPDDKTAEEVRDEGQVQMVSSQDTAVAVALDALGETVTPGLEVVSVSSGSPADGALAVRDLFRKVDGKPLSSDIETASDELRDAIKATPPGQPITFTVLRDGKEVDVPVTPEQPTSDLFGGLVSLTGTPAVGIQLGQGFIFPFPVTVTIDPRIGGPSAGLMFSLGIYDTLTPGSLTGGGRVAGTGEIAADGTVGPIGGIQQKIVGAREDGAQLFLVPADNCDDSQGARNGDMRLVKVTNFDDAKSSIEAWAKDPDAKLPSCG